MDKIKKVAEKQVKKNGKIDWTKVLKWASKIIPILTKGKIKSSVVTSIGALLIAGVGTYYNNTELINTKEDIKVVDTALYEMSEQLREQRYIDSLTIVGLQERAYADSLEREALKVALGINK